MFRLVFLCLFAAQLTTSVVADELVLRKPKSKKLLVLNSGQVFGGQLVSRTDGYDVILPSGRVYVSSDRVRFLATSMQDAYEKMSASVKYKTPALHVEMARWCLTNGLPTFARNELLDALHLDPDYSLAQSMLNSLTKQAKQSAVKKSADQDLLTTMAVQSAGIAERRSLGGLPVQTARTFTARVQTLLSNKCGNAKCHSGGRSDFQFVNTRRASSVVVSEQNLASVLRQIDLKNPQNSALLLKAASMHGGARLPLFSGRAGGSQLRLLQDWVNEVSSEFNPSLATVHPSLATAQLSDSKNPAGSIDREHESLPVTQASYELNPSTQPPVDGTKIQQRSKIETNEQFRQAANVAARSNPFDPMIFNRRYHGQTRSSQ